MNEDGGRVRGMLATRLPLRTGHGGEDGSRDERRVLYCVCVYMCVVCTDSTVGIPILSSV